jgi:glycosyltransferase involved in cell wall biosynthesis
MSFSPAILSTSTSGGSEIGFGFEIGPRAPEKTRFRILHCLRAPVGGLFRHVCDLAIEQTLLGCEVAVVCAEGGDVLTEARLDDLAGRLGLGVHRIGMGREVGIGDLIAARRVTALARQLGVDVLHGHGAKGGAYARIAAMRIRGRGTAPRCFYTPHGGSLHYGATSLKGRVYMAAERRLARITDGIIFESAYARDRYVAQVGTPACAVAVVPNGLLPREFEPVMQVSNAADFLFVGELRRLKGVDLLLEALARLNRARPTTAVIVGAGPDATTFQAQSRSLGLAGVVTFTGAMPARQAFARGRVLVMPSRAESLPYIVLEAAAARMPLIATRVGGIPEVVAGSSTPLVPAEDTAALVQAMRAALERPDMMVARAAELQRCVKSTFTVGAMSAGVLGLYATAAG